jgi:hypothetical protein
MIGAEGVGLAQVPAPLITGAVKAEKLVRVLELLAPMTPGVFLSYPGRRQIMPKLRAFMGALASLNHAGWDLVAAFPQRTMESDTAACGGLRSARDCRPRRALLYHSHSWASPIRRRRVRVTASDIQPALQSTHHA